MHHLLSPIDISRNLKQIKVCAISALLSQQESGGAVTQSRTLSRLCRVATHEGYGFHICADSSLPIFVIVAILVVSPIDN